MTTEQTERIKELRRENYSYRFIGDVLGLSANTVKSVCRRKHFDATGSRKTKAEKENAKICHNCGKPLTDMVRVDSRFCSDACRRKWWKSHRKVTEISQE